MQSESALLSFSSATLRYEHSFFYHTASKRDLLQSILTFLNNFYQYYMTEC